MERHPIHPLGRLWAPASSAFGGLNLSWPSWRYPPVGWCGAEDTTGQLVGWQSWFRYGLVTLLNLVDCGADWSGKLSMCTYALSQCQAQKTSKNIWTLCEGARNLWHSRVFTTLFDCAVHQNNVNLDLSAHAIAFLLRGRYQETWLNTRLSEAEA